MLINASHLVGCPILSLHIGGKIASVAALIVDPNSLKLIACELTNVASNEPQSNILLMESVREFSHLGMIVDSSDDFVAAEDVIRVQEVKKLNFDLAGLKVETRKKSKLGKVLDYVMDTETWHVHQLIVQRPALKALIDPELTIPRSEIVEVTDYKVIVKDEEKKIRESTPAEFIPNFVNPFRKTDLVPETAERKVENSTIDDRTSRKEP